jgi:putative zinc ribbon protein
VVADYIDVFTPTVMAELRAAGELPTQWPRGLAIDTVGLRRKKLVNGKRRSGGEDAGEIFAAMGTNIANGEATPVALALMGGKDHQSALDFFATMPGAPAWVVTDGDEGLDKAIGMAWPQAMHYICEEHLRKLGRKAYLADRLGLLPNGEQLATAVDRAQYTGRYLDELIDLVRALPDTVAPHLRTWLAEYEPTFRRQVAMRAAYPGMPRSIGSTEEFINWVGKKVADRHGSWRNLSRVNLVFQLMLAHRAGVANETRYMQIIRGRLAGNGGATGLKTAADYKRFRDREGESSLLRFLVEINARTSFYRASQQNSARGPRTHKRVARKSAELVAQGLAPIQPNDHNRRPGGPRVANYRSVKGKRLSEFPEGTQWHPTRNGDLRAEDVWAGSDETKWWLCEVHPSHEWKQQVRARTTQEQRCPFCTNRRLSRQHFAGFVRGPDRSAAFGRGVAHGA